MEQYYAPRDQRVGKPAVKRGAIDVGERSVEPDGLSGNGQRFLRAPQVGQGARAGGASRPVQLTQPAQDLARC